MGMPCPMLVKVGNSVHFRYCRNIFRSLINFVSHKRTYCRLAYVKVAAQPVEDDGNNDVQATTPAQSPS